MTQNKIQIFINGKKKSYNERNNLLELLKNLKISKNKMLCYFIAPFKF